MSGGILTAALTLAVIIGGYIFIRYNVKVLSLLGRLVQFLSVLVYKVIGTPLKTADKRLLRAAYLNKESFSYKVVNYFEQMIVALDLHKDGVSVSGMLFFLAFTAVAISLVLNMVSNFGALLLPICAVAIFVIVFIVFRVVAMSHIEKRDGYIMDAVDFLVADISGGVMNAIVRYEGAIHPAIRVYFTQFIDAVRNQGYSFADAMLDLNSKLGPTFSDFAYKAIMFEDKADEGMEEIFTSIIEKNRNRRTLQYNNNLIFNEVKMTFLVSVGIVVFFAVSRVKTDAYFYHFFTESGMGKLLIIADIIIIAAVLAYISAIKSKQL